jgi:hypothetical protein
MGTGYVRQSIGDIVNGNVIDADHFNLEYNQLQSAFNATTGHAHDGTLGEGPKISLVNSVTGTIPSANLPPALASIVGLTTTADQMLYTTNANAYATTALTPYIRGLLNDPDAATARSTLGLGTVATQNTGTSGANVPLLSNQNTFGTSQVVKATGTDSGMWYDSDANRAKFLSFMTTSLNRWKISSTATTDNLNIERFDDAGTSLGVPLSITRSDGTVSIPLVNITGGSVTGITDLTIADGGTGASTATAARTNLGLGSMATQNLTAVNITGGFVDASVLGGAVTAPISFTNATITGGTISGITDLALLDGGTGASTAAAARSNLGLGNVDNTSDVNKPVSTAQAAADALKVNKAGDVMTGTLETTAGFISNTAFGHRLNSSTTSAISYYDNSNYYILFTDSLTGSYNTLRPLRVSRDNNIYVAGQVQAGNGNGILGTDGNIFGSVYGNDWITNWVNGRALAYANDRVANLSYRYVSQGTTSSSSSGYYSTPGGAMLKSIATGGGTSVMFKYIQVYDPVRGWVGFGEA